MIENIVNLFAVKQFGHMFFVHNHLSKGGAFVGKVYLYALIPLF